MSWLIILQLITIAFGYFLSESFVEKSSQKLNEIDDKYGKGCLNLIILFGIISIALKFYHNNYYKSHSNETNVEENFDSISNNYVDSKDSIVYNYDSINDFNEKEYKDTLDSKEFTNMDTSESIHRNIIKNFIISENERDLIKMNENLSNNMIEFWENKYPTIQQVNKIYYKSCTAFAFKN